MLSKCNFICIFSFDWVISSFCSFDQSTMLYITSYTNDHQCGLCACFEFQTGLSSATTKTQLFKIMLESFFFPLCLFDYLLVLLWTVEPNRLKAKKKVRGKRRPWNSFVSATNNDLRNFIPKKKKQKPNDINQKVRLQSVQYWILSNENEHTPIYVCALDWAKRPNDGHKNERVQNIDAQTPSAHKIRGCEQNTTKSMIKSKRSRWSETENKKKYRHTSTRARHSIRMKCKESVEEFR